MTEVMEGLPNEGYNAETDQKKWDLVDERLGLAIEPVMAGYFASDRRDLPSVLEEIFRQSFRFSNGSPGLQALLQIAAIQTIRERADKVGALDDVIAETALGIELDSDKFAPPKQHSKGKSTLRWRERLPAIWDFYVDICVNPNDLDQLQPKDKLTGKTLGLVALFGSSSIGLPYATLFYMARNEQRYMAQGRPNRLTDASRYKSHIRTYGILGQPTGSAEFDVILAEQKAIIDIMQTTATEEQPALWLFGRTHQEVLKLASMWEEHHPGELFFELNGPAV